MNRPVDPTTGKPLPTRLQPGYYPGYSTLGQQKFWDEATRRKVLSRVNEIPPIRFFKKDEVELLQILVDHLLPQDDRAPERRIPIVPWIDKRLFTGRTPGYRFENMPPDGDAYRLGFKAVEQIAQRNWRRSFRELPWLDQEQLLKSIRDAQPMEGAAKIWKQMSIERFWALLLEDCVDVYYAHPWAWDEIGFGGPAYPRGYVRLERGEPEPWEVDEERYEWSAPPNVLSDPRKPDIIPRSENPPGGKGGTH